MFVVTLVHELGHYFVARLIIKEPNAKIYMGFFGKPIIDTKKIRITIFGFFGGYVGNFADDGSEKRSHWAMFFFAGAFFTILLAIPVSLYITGTLSIGSFIAFLPSAPIRPDYISVQIEHGSFPRCHEVTLNEKLSIISRYIEI